MALKQLLNIVICIFQKAVGKIDKSPVNQILEELQLELKQKINEYSEIQVAFVYETPSLAVKPFKKLEKETPIYYKEPGKRSEAYNMARIWLMGMALLEQKQQERKDDRLEIINHLYLVTDEKFSRNEVQLIVMKKEGKIDMHPRFKQLNFMPFLFKSKETDGGDNLEEYIREHGVVKVFSQ